MLWEVPFDSRNPVIEHKVDGIRFKFCLLNEQGQPANTFKEGENFSFHFEMENLRKTNGLEFFGQLVAHMRNNGFCEVISQTPGTTGFPFGEGGCLKVLQTYPFHGKDNQLELTVPWSDDREEWDSRLCEFKSLHQPHLPKGAYYTEFTHTFEYRITPNTKVEVGPVTFKINFKVE
jgi:hypothetical protein